MNKTCVRNKDNLNSVGYMPMLAFHNIVFMGDGRVLTSLWLIFCSLSACSTWEVAANFSTNGIIKYPELKESHKVL